MPKLFLKIDNFYAAVESELNPRIADKPFAVTNGEFIVGFSPQAKGSEGVFPGAPESLAREKSPELICIKGDMERYQDFSTTIARRLETISFRVISLKPGSYAMDIGGCPLSHWNVRKVEETIERLLEGKKFRAGRAEFFTLAEIAAKTAKVNTVVDVPKGAEGAFMSSLSISYLPVAQASLKKLRDMGIETIGDVRKIPQQVLRKILGGDTTRILQCSAGKFEDFESGIRNISRTIRFSNEKSTECELADAAASIASEMLEHEVNAVSIFIGLGYVDGVTVARRLKMSPTADEVELRKATQFLLKQIWKRRTRLKNAKLEAAVEPDNGQISFFENNNRKKIARSVYDVRQAYGAGALQYAFALG